MIIRAQPGARMQARQLRTSGRRGERVVWQSPGSAAPRARSPTRTGTHGGGGGGSVIWSPRRLPASKLGAGGTGPALRREARWALASRPPKAARDRLERTDRATRIKRRGADICIIVSGRMFCLSIPKGQHDAIAPGGFGLVQRGVGAGQDIGLVASGVRNARATSNADGDHAVIAIAGMGQA